eukprot:jgi/Tetstr1/445712/TSEL_003511.t1
MTRWTPESLRHPRLATPQRRKFYHDFNVFKDMRPKMKKMDGRMAHVALTSDFGMPVRLMLPSTSTSGVVCASRTCEDFLHFAETAVAVLILRKQANVRNYLAGHYFPDVGMDAQARKKGPLASADRLADRIVALPLAPGATASPELNRIVGVLKQHQKKAGGIIKHNTNAAKNLAATKAFSGDNVDERSGPEPPAKKAKQHVKPAAGVPAGAGRGRGGAGGRAGGGAKFMFLAIKPARFYLSELHDVLRTKDSWSGHVKMTHMIRRDLEWWAAVRLHEDNIGVVHFLANLSSRPPMLITEQRKRWFIQDMTNDISIHASRTKTMANIWADRLSREIDYDDWAFNLRHFSHLDTQLVQPPWGLIDDLVTKLLTPCAAATVTVPYWPDRSWHQRHYSEMAFEVV